MTMDEPFLSIRDYGPGDEGNVVALFRAIYPGEEERARRMAYPVEAPGHVTTKLGLLGDRLVGQANIFLFGSAPGTASLGYHVHPTFHRRGFGRALCLAAIEDARLHRGIRRLIVRTEDGNEASVALAEDLGFRPMPAVAGCPDQLWLARAV